MKVFMDEFICCLEFASKCTRKKGWGGQTGKITIFGNE